jgi:hypothetical protein
LNSNLKQLNRGARTFETSERVTLIQVFTAKS